MGPSAKLIPSEHGQRSMRVIATRQLDLSIILLPSPVYCERCIPRAQREKFETDSQPKGAIGEDVIYIRLLGSNSFLALYIRDNAAQSFGSVQ